MTFWKDATQGDPKRNFRFKFDGANMRTQEYVVKKVSKPSFTVQETSHKWLNHTFYYPGRLEWNTIQLSLVDPGRSDDTSSALVDWLKAAGYEPPSTANAKRTMSKATASLGNVQIIQLNAEGQPIETWSLTNAWIKDIKFGELDYENDDLTQIDVEIRYDSATFSN